MRRAGERWIGNCPLPDHEDRTPSFTVYPETNSWYCFGCCRGGDVIDLAATAWGYGEGGAAMAAANLLVEFGHSIPERPASWFTKQKRQKPVRDAAEEVRNGVFRRRVFRALILPYLTGIEDEQERRAEIAASWADFEAMCRRIGR